jgi:membrane protein implicated in regulation of membrane protease activity
VRLGDSVWLAEGPNLSEGTSVIVKSVRGTRVIVEEAPARSD